MSGIVDGRLLRLRRLRQGLGGGERQAGGRPGEHLTMPDAERLDPALLPEGERDEEPELDELGNGEVPVELLPIAPLLETRVSAGY